MTKIAVDARCLTNRPTGVANFLISAINHIVVYNGIIEIYLLTHVSLDPEVRQRLRTSKNLYFINSPLSIFPSIGLLWFIFKLKRIVKNVNPDYYWGPGQILPFFIPRKIKTIVTIHDLVFKHYKETMSLPTRFEHFVWVKHSIVHSDFIWCVSNYTKAEIEKYYPTRKCNGIFVGSSVEDSVFKPIRIEEDEEKDLLTKLEIAKPFILFVGTLEPRKNLKFLLRLMPELTKKGLMLAIVGVKGWGQTDIEQILNEKDYPKDKVILTGYISTEELVMLYNLATTLVMPSLNEGFGLPALEAMKCGCPVIASKNSGLIEVVGKVGILIDNYDLDEWITEIMGLRKYSERNREKIIIHSKNFDWEKIINKIIQYLLS